jgi:AhpD family alkylhydroperoxidase
MTPRIDVRKYLASPQGQAMLKLGAVDEASGLEHSIAELIKVRTSQINGCAYCIDMHTKDARAMGETEQRLYALNAWRETPFFSDRERAALEWTEALAHIDVTHAPDELYAQLQEHFDERQIVALTFVAVATNAWNRLVQSFKVPAGTYQPATAVA